MAAVQISSSNPFGSSAPASGNAVAAASQQREIAEVQGAITIAKRFPRDERAAMDRILMACTRTSLAESATYTYARGGTDVSGPSIRLAEAIAQAWGNLTFGMRELEQRNGESTVEAFAWDMEHNVRQTKVFQVPHERHTKAGVKRLTDPRDIYELVANQGARRLRACILGVIPGDVIDAAVAQCDATLKTKVAVTPELVSSLVDKFKQFGVTKAAIEKRLQRNIEAITPAQVVQLGKIFNSLRDGMSSPAEWFETESSVVSNLNDAIAKSGAVRPVAAKLAPAAAEESTTDTTATEPSDEPVLSYANVAQRIERANDEDRLNEAIDTIRFVQNQQHRDELGKLAEKKRASL